MRLKKIKPPCCAPIGIKLSGKVGAACCVGTKHASTPDAQTVTTELTLSDHLNAVKCRLGGFRMRYVVQPGLYAVGRPEAGSDIFVSANYKLSFDILRSSLRGMDAWLLVLDTNGINVWCAAGKGTFGTDELIKRIYETRLHEVVKHRRLILPQLGGPGVAGHIVQKQTGFKVLWGPVDARDICGYVKAGYEATKDMRAVRFSAADRLKLTPMELLPAMKYYPLYALAVLLIFASQPSGFSVESGLALGWPFFLMGAVAVFAGAALAPALLPYIPVRSFSLKGWFVGVGLVAPAAKYAGIFAMQWTLLAMTLILFPLLSSYIALQFTGSTTFTGQSGVNKELRYAVPFYLTGAAISVILVAAFKLSQWGVL